MLRLLRGHRSAARLRAAAPIAISLIAVQGCALLYDFEDDGGGGAEATGSSTGKTGSTRAANASTSTADTSSTTTADATASPASSSTGGDPCVTGPYKACIRSPDRPAPRIYFSFDGPAAISDIPDAPAITGATGVPNAFSDSLPGLGKGWKLAAFGRGNFADPLVLSTIVQENRPFTVELWFNVDETPTETKTTLPFFFSSKAEARISLFASNIGSGEATPDVRFLRRTSMAEAIVADHDEADSLLDRWFHAAATFDGSVVQIHVNGRVATSLATAIALPMSADWETVFYVGGPYSGTPAGDFRFRGMVDELAIYDQVLPTDVILEHCRIGLGAACDP